MTFRLLACGCNLYPGAPGSDLRGCLNDVADVAYTLGMWGYQVEKLENAQATRANIINRLNRLIINSKPGDFIAFYYSGHGTRILDASGEEADGWDEAIACYDFPYGVVRDDEFRALFAKLPAGVTCNAIYDTCHSGTMTRLLGGPGRIKSIPYPLDVSPPEKPKAIIPGLKERVWSACRADQYAYEIILRDGTHRGGFTYFLCQRLRSTPGLPGGFADNIIAEVTHQIQSYGVGQEPQLEYPPAIEHRFPFF
jgi:metacaspase-1